MQMRRSDSSVYGNINKTKEVRRLKKKLRREQRKLNRKLLANIKSYTAKRKPIYSMPLRDMKNIQKQNQQIRNIYKRLTDIRNNYIHQTTNKVVRTKPSRIVVEDLNIIGMMKNHYLARAIAEQKLYELLRQIKYKCQKYGIEFLKVSTVFPFYLTLHFPSVRTLEFLMRHLVRVASYSSETNMHARNLAIVWAPNLLRLANTHHYVLFDSAEALLSKTKTTTCSNTFPSLLHSSFL